MSISDQFKEGDVFWHLRIVGDLRVEGKSLNKPRAVASLLSGLCPLKYHLKNMGKIDQDTNIFREVKTATGKKVSASSRKKDSRYMLEHRLKSTTELKYQKSYFVEHEIFYKKNLNRTLF